MVNPCKRERVVTSQAWGLIKGVVRIRVEGVRIRIRKGGHAVTRN